MILFYDRLHLLCNIRLAQCGNRKIHRNRDHRKILPLPPLQGPAHFLKYMQVQVIGQLRLLQQRDVTLRIHDAQILVMITNQRLGPHDFVGMRIHNWKETYDKIAGLEVIKQILLDDRLMMPLAQVLIVLLLLFPHHVFRIGNKDIYINIGFFPSITQGHKPETDILQLGMGRLHAFHKLFVGNILNDCQVFIPRQPVYVGAPEELLQDLAYADHDFIAVLPAELLVKILQAVDIRGQRAH